jgi:HEAT repeat protein
MRESSRWLFVVGLWLLVAVPLGAQHSFEHVVATLKSPDAATRIRAIQELRDARYPEAALPIASMLEDADDRVQIEAIDAERALFTTRPVSRRKKVGFVVEVRTRDVGAEAFAAGQLLLLPRRVPTEVLWGLVAAMRDDNPRIRLDAMNLFGLLAPLAGTQGTSAIRSGVSWTIEALRRGDVDMQVAAAAVAGRAQHSCGAIPEDEPSGQVCAELGNVLIDVVNSREPRVRRAAMQALGQLRYAAAAQALADQLSYYERGPDAEAALEAMARIGHPASAEIFKRQLGNSNATLRRFAVEGLARAAEPEDVADLDRAGSAERSSAVLLALHFAAVQIHARGKSSSPASPDQLVAALSDSSLRPLALQYLLELSPSIAPALANFLRHDDEETRRLVAEVLGFSRDSAVVPALEAATKDSDAGTALAARQAIERIKLG